MKKVYVYVALFLGLHSAVAASALRSSDEPTSIQARAVVLTRSMAEKMRLDEGQYLKLKKINVRMLTEMDEAKQQLAGTPGALDERMAALQAQYETEKVELLHPAQLLVYQHLQSSRTALNTTVK